MKTEVRLGEFWILTEVGVEGWFGELNAVGVDERGGGRVLQIENTEVGETGFAFEEDEVRSEGGDIGEHDVWTERDYFFPRVARRVGGWGRGEMKGAARRICADIENIR